jgi:sulfur-carrier protein adenylyltransferase/sulfurtransferase
VAVTDNPLEPASDYASLAERYLEGRGLRPRRDDAGISKAYKTPGALGWHIELPIVSGFRDVDLVLPRNFPYKAPRIGVANLKGDEMPIAHVEAQKLLCLSGDGRAHAIVSVDKQLETVLERGAGLFSEPPDALRQQRKREFISYWNIDAGGKPIYSTIDESTPYGVVSVWRGKQYSLVAASDEDARAWLARRYASRVEQAFDRGVYLPSDGIDDQLSQSLSIVLLAERYPHAAKELLAAAAEDRDLTVAVFRLPGEFALVGGRVLRPVSNAMVRTTRNKGFRKGHVPPMIASQRYFPKSRFERARLRRADAPWLLARGGENFDNRLQDAKVCIVGAGSLGSGIARMLVKAGVGHLRIIDPDILDFDNIARHDLGADHVDEAKATALATTLMRQYPIVEVVGEARTWQDALRKNKTIFDVDLVVSTTASWSDEAQLNAVFREKNVPAIFGWLEAHAAAAQVLTVFPHDACMACVFNASGEFLHPATAWKEQQLKGEPACGNFYAPFTDLAAMRGRCLIAEQALAVLVGEIDASQITTEIFDESVWKENGGAVADDFVQRLGHEPSKMGDRCTTKLSKHANCGWCAA